jgi:hypothetical protein
MEGISFPGILHINNSLTIFVVHFVYLHVDSFVSDNPPRKLGNSQRGKQHFVLAHQVLVPEKFSKQLQHQNLVGRSLLILDDKSTQNFAVTMN